MSRKSITVTDEEILLKIYNIYYKNSIKTDKNSYTSIDLEKISKSLKIDYNILEERFIYSLIPKYKKVFPAMNMSQNFHCLEVDFSYLSGILADTIKDYNKHKANTHRKNIELAIAILATIIIPILIYLLSN